jgi:hypothetical protein
MSIGDWFNNDHNGMTEDVAQGFKNIVQDLKGLHASVDALTAQVNALQVWHDAVKKDTDGASDTPANPTS